MPLRAAASRIISSLVRLLISSPFAQSARRTDMSPEYNSIKPAVRDRILLLGAILTLGNLAAVIHQSSRVYLYQQSLCLTYYKAHDPTQIDFQSRVEESMCKVDQVQSQLAVIDGIDSFLSCIPGKYQNSRAGVLLRLATTISPQ